MFSERLKEERKKRGWTQEELAKRSGVGIATIRRYEDKSIPRENSPVLEALAQTLGVYPKWLLKGEGYKTHKEELLAQIENDEKQVNAANTLYRIKLKYELHKKIEEIYYPDFIKEVVPDKVQNIGLENIDTFFDNLTDEEEDRLNKYIVALQKMNEDIDNYIAIRTKKFMREIKEG